jgi:hypothetical protein
MSSSGIVVLELLLIFRVFASSFFFSAESLKALTESSTTGRYFLTRLTFP